MQNNNSKLTNILLIIVIILLAIGIWMLAGKSEREPRIESEPQVVVEEEPQEEEKPTEEKPTVIPKPVATTLDDSPGGGCMNGNAPGSVPCTEPLYWNLSGSFDSKGYTTTTWFEYWTATSKYGVVTPVGSVQSTEHVIQATSSGNVSQKIIVQEGIAYQFRIVTQNAGGTTYGETLFFSIPIA